MTVEATLKKMKLGEDASAKFQAIIDQIDQLQRLVLSSLNDFSDTLERIDNMRYEVNKAKLLSSSLSREFGDTHANIE